MIRSLEGDKYDVLPDVFVRGYLRNYAKLQKIPQNTIMESFDTMVSQQPILSPVKPELKPYLMKQTSFAQGFLSVVGIFIVIITLAIWKWQSTTNNVFQSPEEIWSPTNFMTQTVENIAKSDIVLPTVMVQTDMDAIVAKKVPIKTFTNPYRILRIHFKDKAWIKLVDKERKELYQGIGNIGEILSLEGVPPFNIKVGNFAGVYIEYNNKIDNVKTFSRSQSNKRTFIIGVLDMDHFEN